MSISGQPTKKRSRLLDNFRNAARRPLWQGDADVNAIRAFQNDLARTSVLPHDEQLRLARCAKEGDATARSELLTSNIRLIMFIAKGRVGYGLSALDLISEGMIGMNKAVDKFDPERGVHFSTFASWWILQAMNRAIDNQARLVRLPVHMSVRVRKYRQHLDKLLTSQGSADDDTLMALTGLSADDLVECRSLTLPPISLSSSISENSDACLIDELPAKDESNTDPAEWQSECQSSWFIIRRFQIVWQRLRGINRRNKRIFIRRFGLDGQPPKTQVELSRSFRSSRQRIQQIEYKVLLGLYPKSTINQARRAVLAVRRAILRYDRLTGNAKKIIWL